MNLKITNYTAFFEWLSTVVQSQYLFRLCCCIIFIDVQVVIIVVVVIVVIVVVIVVAIVVADHIDDRLHSNEDEGGEAKGGELGTRGTEGLALGPGTNLSKI